MDNDTSLVYQVKVYLTQSELKKLDDLSQVKYGRSNRSPYLRHLLVKKIKKQQKKNERVQSD